MGPVGTDSNWPVWKSSARLADGREIIYFDETPGLGRALVRDTRPLPPRPPGPPGPVGSAEQGIRWDALTGEWVVIAAARQDRTFLPPADQCPLDPSAPGRPTEIPADSYDVVVFENRFPSLREPLGRCEVICFTADHDSSFAALSPRRVRTVFEAWVDRTGARSALPETRQVYCFENRADGGPGPAVRGGQPVRRARRRRTGGRDADRDPQRALDRVRARGGALAVRGADLPRRPGARPARDRGGGAGCVRAAVPGRAAPVRRAVRPARAVYRRVAPGPGAGRGGAQAVRRAPSGTVCPASARQAQVPRG